MVGTRPSFPTRMLRGLKSWCTMSFLYANKSSMLVSSTSRLKLCRASSCTSGVYSRSRALWLYRVGHLDQMALMDCHRHGRPANLGNILLPLGINFHDTVTMGYDWSTLEAPTWT